MDIKRFLKEDTVEDIQEKIKIIKDKMDLEILEEIKKITNKYKEDLDYFENKLKEQLCKIEK